MFVAVLQVRIAQTRNIVIIRLAQIVGMMITRGYVVQGQECAHKSTIRYVDVIIIPIQMHVLRILRVHQWPVTIRARVMTLHQVVGILRHNKAGIIL